MQQIGTVEEKGPSETTQRPQKFVTGLKVSNQIKNSQKLEKFIPSNGNQVQIYICGPTVYDHTHLGHARTFISADFIRKLLRDYLNYDVKFVSNITDVDDQIVKKASIEQKSVEQVANHWETAFWQDMNSLGVEKPDQITKASQYVVEMQEMISRIIQQGFAYLDGDGYVFFDSVSYKQHYRADKFKTGLDDEFCMINYRNAQGECILPGKKNEMDATLWKPVTNYEKEMHFDSPWGQGRPGWHIECSAMAHSVFGEKIDIKMGGADLAYPHHEHCISQLETYLGGFKGDIKQSENQKIQPVNYVFHFAHLMRDGKQMGKSYQNFITIKDILKTYSSRQIRLFFAMTHYEEIIDYCRESIDQIRRTDEKLSQFSRKIGQKTAYCAFQVNKSKEKQLPSLETESQINAVLQEKSQKIHSHILNNFNIPGVIDQIIILIDYLNQVINIQNATLNQQLSNRLKAEAFKVLSILGITFQQQFQIAFDLESDQLISYQIDALTCQNDLLKDKTPETNVY